VQRKRTDVLSVKSTQKNVKKKKGKEKRPHFIYPAFITTIVLVLSLFFSSKDPNAWKALLKDEKKILDKFRRKKVRIDSVIQRQQDKAAHVNNVGPSKVKISAL